jgi:hypothetical protein
MAQVPINRTPSIAATPGVLPTQSGRAPAQAFGASTARALTELGSTARQVSNQFDKLVLQEAAINNKVAADERAVAFGEAMDRQIIDYKTNNLGMAAFEGLDSAFETLSKERDAGAAGLSPDARLQYDSATRASLARARAILRDHGVSQRKTAILGTSEAKVKSMRTEAATSDNPMVIASAEAGIAAEAAFRELPSVLGWTPEQSQAWMREEIGSIWQGKVVEAQNSGDYLTAQAIYDANKDKMTAEQVKSVTGVLKVGRNAFIANDWADSVVLDRPTDVPNPNPLAALRAAVPGAQVTSTLRTPAKNAAVRGVANSDHLTGEAADFVPAKGQSLDELAESLRDVGIGEVVREKNHVHVEWGKGAGTKRVQLTPQSDPDKYQADMYAAIEEQARRDFPNNPVLREQAASAARSRVNIRTAQLRADQRITYSNLGSAIIEGNIQSEADLVRAYPGAASDLANLSVTQRRALTADLKRNANLMTPERQVNFTTLIGLKASDPQKFLNIDLSTVDLPTSTRLQLIKEQAAIQAKGAKEAAKATEQDTAVKQALSSINGRQALNAIGYTPAKVNAGSDSFDETTADNYYFFIGALQAEIGNYAAVHGKPPPANSKEMAALVSNVTAQVGAKPPSTFLGIPVPFTGEEGRPAYQVPDDQVEAIRGLFQARGVTPTPQQIAEYYRRSQARGR